jgi:hypothetical protein
MTYSDVLRRDVELFREQLKEKHPRMTNTEREKLLQHLVEIKRFIHMIQYGKRPDVREYMQ